MCENLNEMVMACQSALSREDGPAVDELFPRIKIACHDTLRSVLTNAPGYQTLLDDAAEEKLIHCIEKFSGPGNFRNYYRRALVNRIRDEARSRRRRQEAGDRQVHQQHSNVLQRVSCESNDLDAIDFQDELERMEAVYRERKRVLVDSLRFKKDHQLATLLIDQRQRRAKIERAVFATNRCDRPLQQQVESLEVWHQEDHARQLQKAAMSIGEVWTSLVDGILAGRCDANQKGVVFAIAAAGGRITETNWRQRVRRCILEVKDQLSEAEQRYFLYTMQNGCDL